MQIQSYIMLSQLICFSFFKYSCFNWIITQKFWHIYRHLFREAKDAQKQPFWTNLQLATAATYAHPRELRTWRHVPCQLSSKSKAPSGNTGSSAQSLVTPAANPTQNTNNDFSANTEYWDIKELNELGTLCWTLRTEGSVPCRILICSLPRASLATLEWLQVYSADQTEYFPFFFFFP